MSWPLTLTYIFKVIRPCFDLGDPTWLNSMGNHWCGGGYPQNAGVLVVLVTSGKCLFNDARCIYVLLGLSELINFVLLLPMWHLISTMHHSEQKCTHFCSEWCIVEYGTGALWDLRDWSILYGQGQHSSLPTVWRIMRLVRWLVLMMMSWHGNALWRKSTGHWWIPLTKDQWHSRVLH